MKRPMSDVEYVAGAGVSCPFCGSGDEDEAGNRYVLSCTLDGQPPFYEAYGPFKATHQGVLPRLRVAGQEYWGSAWSWRRALRAFCRELDACII